MTLKMYENVNVRKRCPLGVYGPKDVKKYVDLNVNVRKSVAF